MSAETIIKNKEDRVALLETDPPHSNITPLKNHAIYIYPEQVDV